MKMVKSLLLGSAVGVAAVAVAQAADLPVKAAPVHYVKICTLYGDGFYYIPGSDTCIRFGGYVRSDYNFNGRTPHVTGTSGSQDRTVNRWTTRHRANLTTDARTQTGYGTLRAYTSINAEVAEGTATLGTHRAFIQWGGFTFGRTSSFVDHEGSIGDGGIRSLYTGLVDSTTGAAGINQIAYTWQLGNGITLNVGADDPRNGTVHNASGFAFTPGSDPTTSRHGTSHPDPWVALRVSQAWGRASIAVLGHEDQATYYTAATPGFAGCTGGNTGTSLCDHPADKWGWAVLAGIEIKLDTLSPGTRLLMYATSGEGATRMSANSQASPGLYGSGNQIALGLNTDSVYINGGSQHLTSHWSAGGGFEYFWTRNFSSTIYGGYTQFSYDSTVIAGRYFCAAGSAFAAVANCDPGYSLYQVGTHHDWFPIAGLRLAVDVLYTGVNTAFNGQTATLAKFQGRPSGTYAINNQGLTSVMFRAQRSWGGAN